MLLRTQSYCVCLLIVVLMPRCVYRENFFINIPIVRSENNWPESEIGDRASVGKKIGDRQNLGRN